MRGAFLVVLWLVFGGAAQAQTVFAAASLRDALDQIAAAWAQTGQPPVRISYAGSSALARQIEAGATADIFISADLDWMDYLAQRNLIRGETRRNLVGNRLVLAAPAGSASTLRIAPGFDLAGALGDRRLAMADVRSVPAGRYGQAALIALNVWPAVQAKVVQAENVRAALAFVARGEAPFGIVYETDAVAEVRVRIVDRFPTETHPPIIYPAAVLAASTHPQSAPFAAFLAGAEAGAIFRRWGFAAVE